MNAIMLKKRWKFCLDFGKFMLLTALSFPGSGEIPFPDISCTENISSVAPKTHLSLCSFKPDFRIAQCGCLIDLESIPIL